MYILSNTAPMVQLLKHRLREQSITPFEHFIINSEAKIRHANVEREKPGRILSASHVDKSRLR